MKLISQLLYDHFFFRQDSGLTYCICRKCAQAIAYTAEVDQAERVLEILLRHPCWQADLEEWQHLLRSLQLDLKKEIARKVR